MRLMSLSRFVRLVKLVCLIRSVRLVRLVKMLRLRRLTMCRVVRYHVLGKDVDDSEVVKDGDVDGFGWVR